MLAMRKNKTQKDSLLGILMILANTLNQKIIPMKQRKILSFKKSIFYLKNVLTVSTINVNNFLIMFSQEVDKQNAIWRKKEDCKRKKKGNNDAQQATCKYPWLIKLLYY